MQDSGEHIKVIKMRDAHIVNRKVKPKGWEKVIRIDSQFVLVSDERFVNTIKAGAKFFMDVFLNFSRLVSKGDQRAKKHMSVLIECRNLIVRKVKWNTGCRPPHIERDLHFDGLSFNPIDFGLIRNCINKSLMSSFISVIKQKSSANGVVMILCY